MTPPLQARQPRSSRPGVEERTVLALGSYRSTRRFGTSAVGSPKRYRVRGPARDLSRHTG